PLTVRKSNDGSIFLNPARPTPKPSDVSSARTGVMSLRISYGPIALLLLLGGCAGGHGPELFGEEMHGPIAGQEDYVEYVSWGEPTVVPGDFSAPAGLTGSGAPSLLDTGDRLRIFVYGQPNLSRIYVVDHAGKIAVPLIGNVTARGLTTDGL